jgi:hypothetical protein
MRKLFAVSILAALPACGGSSSPSTPATPAPTPTPAPTFAGSYSGNMLYNVAGQAEVVVPARTAVTQNGNTIDFSNLVLSPPGINPLTYVLGSAVLNGNAFSGTTNYASSGCAETRTNYASSGCGRIDVTTTGRFAGNLMNLTAVLVSAQPNVQGCARSEMRGELSR